MKNWIIGVLVVVVALAGGVGTAYGANRLLGAPTVVTAARTTQRKLPGTGNRPFLNPRNPRFGPGFPGRPFNFPRNGQRIPRRTYPYNFPPNAAPNNQQVPMPRQFNWPVFPGQ